MEVLVVLVLLFIAWAFISSSIADAKRKENQQINEQISSGKLVRLSNGEVKSPTSLTPYEKTMLPEYKYLLDYGSKYGYKANSYEPFSLSGMSMAIDYMSVDELKAAVKIVQRKRTEEENEKRRIEIEIRQKEEERRRLEEEIREKERIRDDRARKWEMLSQKILFEIQESNPKSKWRGIYIIHCIFDNRIYIGSSMNMLTRKSQHLSGLRNKKHHSFLLQEAFNELGEINFRFYALQLIDKNDLFMINHFENEEEIERALKKETKALEQSYLNSYTPTFNVDDDTRGRRHWEGNSKYWSRYSRY